MSISLGVQQQITGKHYTKSFDKNNQMIQDVYLY